MNVNLHLPKTNYFRSHECVLGRQRERATETGRNRDRDRERKRDWGDLWLDYFIHLYLKQKLSPNSKCYSETINFASVPVSYCCICYFTNRTPNPGSLTSLCCVWLGRPGCPVEADTNVALPHTVSLCPRLFALLGSRWQRQQLLQKLFSRRCQRCERLSPATQRISSHWLTSKSGSGEVHSTTSKRDCREHMYLQRAKSRANMS